MKAQKVDSVLLPLSPSTTQISPRAPLTQLSSRTNAPTQNSIDGQKHPHLSSHRSTNTSGQTQSQEAVAKTPPEPTLSTLPALAPIPLNKRPPPQRPTPFAAAKQIPRPTPQLTRTSSGTTFIPKPEPPVQRLPPREILLQTTKTQSTSQLYGSYVTKATSTMSTSKTPVQSSQSMPHLSTPLAKSIQQNWSTGQQPSSSNNATNCNISTNRLRAQTVQPALLSQKTPSQTQPPSTAQKKDISPEAATMTRVMQPKIENQKPLLASIPPSSTSRFANTFPSENSYIMTPVEEESHSFEQNAAINAMSLPPLSPPPLTHSSSFSAQNQETTTKAFCEERGTQTDMETAALKEQMKSLQSEIREVKKDFMNRTSQVQEEFQKLKQKVGTNDFNSTTENQGNRQRSKSVDSAGALHKLKENSVKFQHWVANQKEKIVHQHNNGNNNSNDRQSKHNSKEPEDLRKKDDFF